MSGCYKSLQARMKELCETAVTIFQPVKKLCGSVQTGAVYIAGSYKRMEVWIETVEKSGKMHSMLRRLQKNWCHSLVE
ncbi:hypothetical protein FOCC_FOCC007303 [Frankliniella occidentalis]|nr:hypothetical protein FOCC_FOCC007303 [Frankliniella occidentalis]